MAHLAAEYEVVLIARHDGLRSGYPPVGATRL